MANKPPPKIVIHVEPATPKAKKGNAYEQFIAYWGKKYPSLVTNKGAILAVAKAQHIDPVTFAALLLNESGANHGTADSSTGAIGIGQLMPSSFIGPNAFNGGVLPWAPNHKITEKDLRDPGINMRLSAAYFGYLQGQYPADPYGRYNAGPNKDPKVTAKIQQDFTAKWITPWNKTYVPSAPTSPPSAAGQQVPGGTGTPTPDNTFTDLYVTGVNKQGKFVTTRDPNKALQYDGAPLTRSAFLTLRDKLTSHYISYTGKRPSIKQIENYVKNGWNDYTLDQLLSKSASFTKSPIYKQYSANFGAKLKDLLPPNGKVPTELLRQAAVNGWDGDAIAEHLRKQKTYLNSNEFKGSVATLLNTHTSIMGTPDTASMVTVKDAALAGWDSNQYAAYLRSQPAYKSSPEYQTKALGMLSSIGLLTGSQTVLAKGVGPGPGAVLPATQGTLPKDKRVKGTPTPRPPLDLGATLYG